MHGILPAYILHVVGDKFDIYKEQCDDRIQELTYWYIYKKLNSRKFARKNNFNMIIIPKYFL